MHTLYWNRNSSSLAPMAVLEETGTPYEAVWVDMATGAHKSPAHRARHPLGLVPVLTLPDGTTLIESAAITAYCADLNPDAGLAPPIGSADRGRYMQWLIYGAATIYTTYMRIYQLYDYRVREDDDHLIRALAEQQLAERWRVVEDELSHNGGAFLLGEKPSAADIYLAMLAGWHPDPPTFWDQSPRLKAMRDGVNRLDGLRRAVAVHFPGEDLRLG
ncbi:MAG: glutathione S-transferase family protein [Alphaproteobacteria bacterium]|nr:glutathione S-transferase family protein [Alphaproteobacteria bacterium]